tara:strand:+ start:180 stop:608 length:429 start_codon:yes stop_codon:yes gene_type:complete
MATTATISIASDIMTGFAGISKTMTLTEAGGTSDLKETTGYSRKKLASDSKVDLFTMANTSVTSADNVGAKVFIKNIGNGAVPTSIIAKDKFVKVFINAVEVGLLYGGDWMMVPVSTVDAEDIEVQPETDDAVVLEYVMFYQ